RMPRSPAPSRAWRATRARGDGTVEAGTDGSALGTIAAELSAGTGGEERKRRLGVSSYRGLYNTKLSNTRGIFRRVALEPAQRRLPFRTGFPGRAFGTSSPFRTTNVPLTRTCVIPA